MHGLHYIKHHSLHHIEGLVIVILKNGILYLISVTMKSN